MTKSAEQLLEQVMALDDDDREELYLRLIVALPASERLKIEARRE